MKVPRVFFPRGTLQNHTSSEWLNYSVARGLRPKHVGKRLFREESKIFSGAANNEFRTRHVTHFLQSENVFESGDTTIGHVELAD